MVAHQVLVEMLQVPAPVHAPVQLQRQPRIRRRDPLRRRLAEPVEQPLDPVVLIMPPIASELQLARLQHRQSARLHLYLGELLRS
jgi:hypothetical protein